MARTSGPLVLMHQLAWRCGLDVLPVPAESRRTSGMAEEDVFRLQNVLQRLLEYSRDDAPPHLPEWSGLVTRALEHAQDGRFPHGQFFQDVWVLQQTGEQRDGFFVEIGAGDGQYLSNSLMLEREFGWSGILCEPNPAFVTAIEALGRPRAAVVPLIVGASSGQTVSFTVADERSAVVGSATAWSRLRDRVRPSTGSVVSVGTVSPRDMLAQHGAPTVIDYVSIDTEGSEPEILRAFPWSEHHVRLLTVEHNHVPGRQAELDSILVPHGYRRVLASWSGVDAWYVHRDEPGSPDA